MINCIKNTEVEELHDSTVEEEGITKTANIWCTMNTIKISNLCTEIQEAVIEDINQEVEKCIDNYLSKAAGAVQPSQTLAGIALADAIIIACLHLHCSGSIAGTVL